MLDWYRTLSHSLFWEPWMASDDAALRDAGRALSAMLFEHGEPVPGAWMRGELDSERVVADVARAVGVDPAFAMRGLMHSCARMTLASAEILPRVAALRASGLASRPTTWIRSRGGPFRRWGWTACSIRS